MKTWLHILAALAMAASPAPALAQDKPVVYNNMEGDGGVALDRAIKAAYAQKYTVVDTGRSGGYLEPNPVSGEMPKSPATESGQLLGGYALIAYIVSAHGLVSDPVVLRSSDPRLSQAALRAMALWRFSPGRLRGAPVATTAAQEFNFGPLDVSRGYEMKHLGVYQARDVLVKRMPPSEAVTSYVAQLRTVARNFFVGVATPEILHIVVVTRPGPRSRVWLVSSIRPGNSGELEPLRKLLESVPPIDVSGGPVVLAVSGWVAGGDGSQSLEGDAYRNPVPAEWREIAMSLRDPPAFSSDAFLDLVWPAAK